MAAKKAPGTGGTITDKGGSLPLSQVWVLGILSPVRNLGFRQNLGGRCKKELPMCDTNVRILPGWFQNVSLPPSFWTLVFRNFQLKLKKTKMKLLIKTRPTFPVWLYMCFSVFWTKLSKLKALKMVLRSLRSSGDSEVRLPPLLPS